MTIQEYVNNKKEFLNILLAFIDTINGTHDEFDQIINYIDNFKLIDKKEEFTNVLRIIYKISKNHHRSSDFFFKIEQILLHFEEKIKQTYSNSEIFNFFQNNKRILLFLFEKKILIPDKSIIDQILQKSYLKDRSYRHFFIPEIKLFADENTIEKIEEEITKYDQNFYTNFEEKRKKGENETFICQLIRNDSVEEFIAYVNRTNFHISSSKIYPSIFETNSFLIKKNVSLIEYAAFYGSIQIFQYLMLNNVVITPLLWYFVIHGRKPELIHILEENHIDPPFDTYLSCFGESIKCHHNEIADYISDNLLNTNNEEYYNNKYVISNSIHFYNYFYFPKEFNSKFVFNQLCQYDHLTIIELLIENIKENNKENVKELK